LQTNYNAALTSVPLDSGTNGRDIAHAKDTVLNTITTAQAAQPQLFGLRQYGNLSEKYKAAASYQAEINSFLQTGADYALANQQLDTFYDQETAYVASMKNVQSTTPSGATEIARIYRHVAALRQTIVTSPLVSTQTKTFFATYTAEANLFDEKAAALSTNDQAVLSRIDQEFNADASTLRPLNSLIIQPVLTPGTERLRIRVLDLPQFTLSYRYLAVRLLNYSNVRFYVQNCWVPR
jgi:hypothetical protein